MTTHGTLVGLPPPTPTPRPCQDNDSSHDWANISGTLIALNSCTAQRMIEACEFPDNEPPNGLSPHPPPTAPCPHRPTSPCLDRPPSHALPTAHPQEPSTATPVTTCAPMMNPTHQAAPQHSHTSQCPNRPNFPPSNAWPPLAQNPDGRRPIYRHPGTRDIRQYLRHS
jgi:hypothetical protein